jgi:hypothetical protein
VLVVSGRKPRWRLEEEEQGGSHVCRLKRSTPKRKKGQRGGVAISPTRVLARVLACGLQSSHEPWLENAMMGHGVIQA